MAKYKKGLAFRPAERLKKVIDKRRERGEKVGMVRIKMFRPFPVEDIKKVLLGKAVHRQDSGEIRRAVPGFVDPLRQRLLFL